MSKYIKLKRTHAFACDTTMISNIEGDKTILIEIEKMRNQYHILCTVNGIFIQTWGYNISIYDVLNRKTYKEEDIINGLYE